MTKGWSTLVAFAQRQPILIHSLIVFFASQQRFSALLHWRNTFHLNVPGSLPKPCERLLRFGTIGAPCSKREKYPSGESAR